MAERRSVAADVVGSKPTSRPKHLSSCHIAVQPCPASPKFRLPHRRSAFTLELPAGLIRRGSRSSILRARRLNTSSSFTPRSSPRLRSTTPFVRCRRRRCSKAGWPQLRRTSGSASRRHNALRTSGGCKSARTMWPSSSRRSSRCGRRAGLASFFFSFRPTSRLMLSALAASLLLQRFEHRMLP